MAGVARLEDLVVAGHHTPIFTRSSSSSRRRRRPQRSTSVTKRPSSHRRPLPPLTTLTTAKIRRRTYNPHNLQYNPTPRRGGATPLKLFSLLPDLISWRLSFVRVFHSPPDFAFGFIANLPNSAWQLFGLEQEPVYLTSESSLEDGGNGGGVWSIACRLYATLPRG